MSRKSNDLDKKMLQAGIALLKKHGASKLSVRDIARKAGANLGMFNYYFGTKEKFLLLALNEIYIKFLKELGGASDKNKNLQDVLFQMAKFSRDNRELLTAILADILSNEPVVTRFFRKNFTQHFELLENAMKNYLRDKKIIVKNPHHALRFLIGAVGIPNILLEIYNHGAKKTLTVESDQELEARVHAAMMGLHSF